MSCLKVGEGRASRTWWKSMEKGEKHDNCSLLISLIFPIIVCCHCHTRQGLCALPALYHPLYIVVEYYLYLLRLCQLRNSLEPTATPALWHLTVLFLKLTPTSPLVPSCILPSPLLFPYPAQVLSFDPGHTGVSISSSS